MSQLPKTNSNLAKSFDEQCLKGKYFGRFSKNSGTWRCQLKRGHLGSHVDVVGRSWPLSKRELDKLFKPEPRS